MTAAVPWGAPHFFVLPSQVADGWITLTGDEARHLSKVLRAQVGDPVSVADGTGQMFSTVVRSLGAEVTLEVEAAVFVPPPVPAITVVHALPKGRKLDEVVEKLSEIGADRLLPVISDRSQVDLHGERAAKALRRWRAVALAAGKQSRRARLLEVAEIGAWRSAFPRGVPGVVLWEEAVTPLRSVLAGIDQPAELVLGIGPEGGLSREEVAAAGLPPASLGPTILRTQTAALVATTATLTLLGRLA